MFILKPTFTEWKHSHSSSNSLDAELFVFHQVFFFSYTINNKHTRTHYFLLLLFMVIFIYYLFLSPLLFFLISNSVHYMNLCAIWKKVFKGGYARPLLLLLPVLVLLPTRSIAFIRLFVCWRCVFAYLSVSLFFNELKIHQGAQPLPSSLPWNFKMCTVSAVRVCVGMGGCIYIDAGHTLRRLLQM